MEPAVDWQSACVPKGIRQPWTVFHEDLEDKVADAQEQDTVAMPAIQEKLQAVEARGAHAVFRELPAHTQRTYAEVSLMELSAYVAWGAKGGPADARERDAAWEALDCDDKADFVPEDPRAALAQSPAWKALLADGAPLCGEALAAVGPSEGSNSGCAGAKGAAASTSVKPKPTSKPTTSEPTTKVDTPQRSGQKPSGSSAEKTQKGRLPPSRAVQKRAEASKQSKPSAPSQRAKDQRTNRAPSPPASSRPQRSCRVAPSSSPEPPAAHRARAPSPKKRPGLRVPVAENLCPEALETACCICSQCEATDENDLAMCDRCDRGFHQLCHDPPVAHFGRPEDQWFCGECTLALADERGLSRKTGEFVWASSSACPDVWPARVLRIDFTSVADTRPYWVQFFDSVKGPPTGAWVGESQALSWVEGPAFDTVKDARRRLAIRLAEADGAAPISGGGAVAPTPLSTHLAAAARPPPASAGRPPKRSRRTVSAPEEEDTVQKAGTELKEMRGMIAAARLRQARLELQLEEAAE